MADLANIVPGERTIDIVYPGTEKFAGLRWTLMSLDDPRMKAIRRQLHDQRTKAEQRGSIVKAAELEQNQNLVMFRATTGWEWTDDADGDKATFNGEVPDFNQKNVIDVLEKLAWIGEQVNAELVDEKAFFSRSNPT